MKKPSILILLSNFSPGYMMGGPLTSNLNLINALKNEVDFKIITSNHDFGDKKPYKGIEANKWISFGEFKVWYLNPGLNKIIAILKALRDENFDTLYINSFFDFYFSIIPLVYRFLGLYNPSKIVLVVRGEFYEDALFFSKNKKKLFLFISNLLDLHANIEWHASSDVEKIQIEKIIQTKNKVVKVISNIPNIQVPNSIDFNSNNKSNKIKIIWLARIAKDKNIQFAFKVLSKVSCDVEFDIYGPIEDLELWDNCKKISTTFSDNIVVNHKGVIEKSKTQKLLSEYDLLFLPSFSENFGHSIVESLLVGTPVLISNNTPWKNLEDDGIGFDIDLNNIDEFVNAINLSFINKNTKKVLNRSAIRDNILKRLDYNNIILKYKESFNIN